MKIKLLGTEYFMLSVIFTHQAVILYQYPDGKIKTLKMSLSAFSRAIEFTTEKNDFVRE